MAIGIFALVIGAICIAIRSAGISNVEHPEQKERKVNFPFPTEL